MPLATGDQVLRAAQRDGYAVGAFNCHTLDMIPAVVEVAAQERSPVILQFTEGSIKSMGWEYVSVVAQRAGSLAPVPVVIHLDHGPSRAVAEQAVRFGFTSVMIDGSELPYAANVALTRQVVEFASAAGVSVEAEIGHVGGTEDDQGSLHGWLTPPEEAARFHGDAGMNSLATAFGTAHGFYKEEPKLDIERLRQIRALVGVPLVMHGGSGVPADQVRAAIAAGICKVNVATELKDGWARALRQTLERLPGESDPRKLLAPSRAAVQEIVREKMRLFGSCGAG